MMRPDDESLDRPCKECSAAVGMPCTVIVRTRQGPKLIERGVCHSSRRATVALADPSPVPVAEPPAAASVDTVGPASGAAEGRPFDGSTETPLPGQPVDGTITRAADVPAALGLPLVELECGNPASTREAIKALQNPNADIFCWFHGKYEKRRAS